MKDLSIYVFSHYASFIIFLHVLSAIIWIGGMIAIRFAVHFSLQSIDTPTIKLQTTLLNLKFFFKLVIPSIIILLVTALIMILAVDYKTLNLSLYVHLKESIWTVMTLVFIVIYKKHHNASVAFKTEDFQAVKQNLQPIAQYLIPLNIILGLAALYFGITLRGM